MGIRVNRGYRQQPYNTRLLSTADGLPDGSGIPLKACAAQPVAVYSVQREQQPGIVTKADSPH